MANQADIKAVITAEDKASSTLKGFADTVEGVGGKILGVAKIAGEALLAGGAAAVAFGVSSVHAYQESENVQAQLTAALLSTHGAAKLNIQDLNDQALALQKVTKFSDEQINSSQALLLTFTSIHGAVFQQATPAILDLAQAMHEDLQSATIQVGKALNDPVLGITALHRIGVTFTETQKNQIKGFVDTNQLAKAQGIILKELNTEFGGSAEAAGKTFGGQLIILKNRLNDIQESIGKVIVQALTPFVTKAADWVKSVDWTNVLNKTMAALRNFWDTLTDVYAKISQVAQRVIEFLEPSFVALWHTIEQKVLPTLLRLWHEVIEPLLPVIGAALVIAIKLAADTLNILFQAITPVINFMLDHKWIVEALAVAFGALATSMALGSAFDALKVAIVVFQTTTVPSLLATLSTVGAAFIAAIPVAAILAAFAVITVAFLQTMDTLKTTKQHVQDDIKSINDSTAQLKATEFLSADPAARARAAKALAGLAAGKARGGTVTAGTPYIVGEEGQELFVPGQSGTIVPHDELTTVTPGSNITIQVNAGAFMGTQIDARKYAQLILESLQDLAAKKNTSLSNMIGARV